MDTEEILFADGAVTAFRFHPGNIRLAQEFLEANPAFTEMIAGRPPVPGEALHELTDFPASVRPADAYVIGLRLAGDMVGFAGVLRSWPVEGVSQITLFQIAESQQGSGVAHVIHSALERWIIAAFAPRWLRLGVVEGNARGRRFWASVGYHEMERKRGFEVGNLTHTLVIMIKSLQGGDDADYRKFIFLGSMPPR